jgi:hypothetical protein
VLETALELRDRVWTDVSIPNGVVAIKYGMQASSHRDETAADLEEARVMASARLHSQRGRIRCWLAGYEPAPSSPARKPSS